MSNIGFVGGSMIMGIGPKEGMATFYRCISDFVVPSTGKDFRVLTDRLYRRYVSIEDLDSAIDAMADVKESFSKISLRQVPNLVATLGRSCGHDVDSNPNLGAAFSKYFEGFDICASDAKSLLRQHNTYVPLMTVVASIPEALTDYSHRPLAEFDNLEGLPLWLR
jgi:hypothetical protein